MSFDPGPYRRQAGTPGVKPPGLLAKAFAVVAAVTIAIVALMFSVVVFAIALAVGVIVWGWLWWKMRALRKQMESDPQFQEMRRRAQGRSSETGASGDVIEGVVIREVDEDSDRR
ncbi:hypothetical protein [Pseudazoarcus pumilus]|uniref:Uncharacterized protein n=1 Tax=Pseudazoarcus pumilus TaxID=2067960 RepID=A0A2I6S7T4_9RHOO|nr:hypothetical protein [Pseudazoarcus pumilus]AUN95315.1 hypothetical protein C0099_10475 [Pseudazoarcus pumilus]